MILGFDKQFNFESLAMNFVLDHGIIPLLKSQLQVWRRASLFQGDNGCFRLTTESILTSVNSTTGSH